MKRYQFKEEREREIESLSPSEVAGKLRRFAGRLPYYCWDVSRNLYRDADEIEKGILPGSKESWRYNAGTSKILGG